MQEQKHSGLGIASFVLSILLPICFFVLSLVASILDTASPGNVDEDTVAAAVLGVLLVIVWGASLIAIGLGIGGLVQTDRKRVFAWLGITLSVAGLLIEIVLLVAASIGG